MIQEAKDVVDLWLTKYPAAGPWVDDNARTALRCAETAWLDKFKGLHTLSRDQVHELLNWKWQGYGAKRSKSQNGVDDDWDHARGCIERALAEVDPGKAIDALRWPTKGIPTWQTSTSSVVLSACQPDAYTVVDSYALRTFMMLEGKPQATTDRVTYFERRHWLPYLATCLELSQELSVSLRDLDRAFWASAGRRVPV
jgi:hypothetical protein